MQRRSCLAPDVLEPWFSERGGLSAVVLGNHPITSWAGSNILVMQHFNHGT